MSRSGIQHSFIVGHELAHVVVAALPADARDMLLRKLRDTYRTGQPPEPGGQEISAPALTRISETGTLATECLCDALSLVGLLNQSCALDDALDAAQDAVGLLTVLHLVDHNVREHSREARGNRPPGGDPRKTAGEFDDFFTRRICLVWLANYARWSSIDPAWPAGPRRYRNVRSPQPSAWTRCCSRWRTSCPAEA